MKRVGKRGSGEFERISWDEALDIIAEKYRYTLDTYGPEAFFLCATGTRNYPIQRLFNLTGGHLGTINSESNGQIAQTANYLFVCAAWERSTRWPKRARQASRSPS